MTIVFEDLLVAATALQIGFGAVTGNVGEGDAVACPRCIGDNTHTVRYWPGASA